jgi:hypothetical protein
MTSDGRRTGGGFGALFGQRANPPQDDAVIGGGKRLTPASFFSCVVRQPEFRRDRMPYVASPALCPTND